MSADSHSLVRNAVSERERRRLEGTVAAIEGAPRSILDCGGGAGLLSNVLRATHPDSTIVLADLSFSQLKRAGVLRRVAADSAALPFCSDAFDLVISTEMLEHIPDEQAVKAFSELIRVARRDIIVTVPNREDLARAQLACKSCGTIYHPHGHQRSYTSKSLAAFATDAEVVRIMEIGVRQLRLPSALLVMLRRAHLVPRPVVSEACPSCGSNASDLHRDRLSALHLIPLVRRPWLLMHCRAPRSRRDLLN